MATWIAGLLVWLTEQPQSVAVFVSTSMDLLIAGGAVIISTRDPSRIDARIVGAISMALMPAHWVVSVGQGIHGWGWTLYAVACNGAFVVQCFIVRGWLDGLGRGLGHFLGRFIPVSLFRTRGR
jgi:hypothetical protein